MPSPFPGMDPFLENPAIWGGVHDGMIAYLREALNPLLAPRYFAEMGERVYVAGPDRNIYPDDGRGMPPNVPPRRTTSMCWTWSPPS